MRNRVLLAAGTVAAFVPALLLAQRPMTRPAARPMMAQSAGPHLENTWELSAGVGGLLIGKAPTGKSAAFAPGGVLRVGYNFNPMWNVSVGTYGGYGTSQTPGVGSTAYLSPFVAATWTPNIDQVTSPFVTAGVGMFWRKNKSQSDAAAHVGVGLRHILKDNLAVRAEVGLAFFNFKPGNSGSSTMSGAGFGSVGLSYFLSGKKTVTSVHVSPAVATLASLRQTQQLTASVLDQRGNPMTGQAVGWRSSNPSVASVSPSGMVTAVGNGSATITASAAAISGTASVTVSQTAASVSVSPSMASLNAIGATQQLSATAQDANSNAVSGATFSWMSSDPTVASVSSSGVVTAVSNGTARITATSGRGSASTTVTVSQTTASVLVTPATSSFSAAGANAQLTASAMDANGNAITGKTFNWTSDAPTVATVNQSGLVTSVANGAAHISASVDGVTGSATVTVLVAAKGAPPVALPTMPEVNRAIVMPHVTFRSGRATLTPQSRAELDRFAIAMQAVPNARWQIDGYTDASGSRTINIRLSRQRAQAVKDYLVRKGVSASSMTVVGYGPARPIASNRTAAGRAQNRRIEVKRLR